jgi:hypothetical protein
MAVKGCEGFFLFSFVPEPPGINHRASLIAKSEFHEQAVKEEKRQPGSDQEKAGKQPPLVPVALVCPPHGAQKVDRMNFFLIRLNFAQVSFSALFCHQISCHCSRYL